MDKGNALIFGCIGLAILGGAVLWEGSGPSTGGAGQQASNVQPAPSAPPVTPPGSPTVPPNTGNATPQPAPQPVQPPVRPPVAPQPPAAVPSNLTDQDLNNKRNEAIAAYRPVSQLPRNPVIDARRQKIENTFNFGDQRFRQREWNDAYMSYAQVVSDCAALTAQATDLIAAESARQAFAGVRTRAEQLNASSAAPAEWTAAEAKRTAAEQAYAAQRYRDAAALWQDSIPAYQTAIAVAGKAEVQRLLKVAQAQANPTDAFNARETLRQIRALDANNAQAAEIAKKIDPFLYFRNSADMIFAQIGPGKYVMGTANSAPYLGEPPRQITLEKPFWMGITEVTQAQYEAIMDANPSFIKGNDLPVTNVSWQSAVDFCRRLNMKEKKRYRLPTEAEWEYACRAGSTGPFAGKLDDMGWFVENSDRKPHPVSQKQPNAWGLYDMHGGVGEWCADLLPDQAGMLQPNPLGRRPNNQRDIVCVRGGGYNSPEANCRSACRAKVPSGVALPNLGFRVLLEAD